MKKHRHSSADRHWALEIMRDRPRLDALIQESHDGVPGAYDEVEFLNEMFRSGMPCMDVDGKTMVRAKGK